MDSKSPFDNRRVPSIRRRVIAVAAILAATIPVLTLMATAPRASLSEQVLDLGVVRRGTVVRNGVVLMNSGLLALTVNNAAKTCGLRAVATGPISVAAGDTAVLGLEADTSIFPEGPSSREISFSTNDPLQPLLTLTVRADVQSEAVAVPRVIRITPGSPTTTIKLKVNDSESMQWHARATDPRVIVDMRPAASGEGHQLELVASLRGNAHESWDFGLIVISAEGRDTREVLRIPVRGPFPLSR